MSEPTGKGDSVGEFRDDTRDMARPVDKEMTDERKESLADVLAEIRTVVSGEDEILDWAARIEAAHAREIAERYAVMHEQGLTIRTLEAEIALLKDECRRLADRAGGFMELARRHGATEKELWP